ncbi:MAG: DUF3592 domain-containing protein [Kiritimatiellia bacterium]
MTKDDTAKGPKTRVRWFLWFFSIAGMLGVIISIRDISLAIRSRSWASTDGHVIVSEVRHGRQAGGNARGSRAGNRATVRARITYSYSVGGASYTNSAICAGDPHSFHTGSDVARALVRRFPEGSEVVVHYDTSRPSNALLLTGFIARSLWLGPVASLLFVALGYFVDIVIPQMKRSKP